MAHGNYVICTSCMKNKTWSKHKVCKDCTKRDRLRQVVIEKTKNVEEPSAVLARLDRLLGNCGLAAGWPKDRDRLRKENRELKNEVERLQALNLSLAERCEKQSELLSRRAERERPQSEDLG